MEPEHVDGARRQQTLNTRPDVDTSNLFRGPFADGVPPAELDIDAPSLRGFGLAELRRLIVIVVVLARHIVAGTLGWLFRRKGRAFGDALSTSVVEAFEDLGPTFIKFGQLMASSPGLFPAALADAALKCLDEVPPFDGSVARELILADLGMPVDEIFSSFDESPLSAASIGQVHACVLPDGRDAVIKIQRPGIRARMSADLRILGLFSRSLERVSKVARLAKLIEVIEDLHATTFQELNPALEAYRQDQFRTNLHAFGDNLKVTAPEVYWNYCGPHTLCMERMSGTPLDEFDELRARGIDGELLLRRGVKAWIEASIVHGLFHGDGHAGNLWILTDGRFAFLDFGIMGEIPETWRGFLRDMFYTFTIDGDFTRTARSLKDVGIIDQRAGTDAEISMRLQLVMGPLLRSGLEDISLGEVVKSMLSLASQYEGTTATELVLFVKQVLYFERYAKELAPNWALPQDLYLLRNIFPAEVTAKAAELDVTLPD